MGEGERNGTATRLAGRYASAGLSQREIWLILSKWNEKNMPPMEDKELITVIESIYSKESINEDRSSQLETLSDILKIKVISVKHIMSDSETRSITLEFDKGICTISMIDLMSPHKFQQEIASATNEVIKKLSPRTHPTHEYLARLVLKSSQVFAADPEATDLGEALELITDYVQSQASVPTIENKEDRPQAGPFIYNKFIWIKLINLVQRSAVRWGIRISTRAMSTRLRRIDMVKDKFGGDSYWGIQIEMVKWRKSQNEGI